MDKESVRALLPKVGDKRLEKLSITRERTENNPAAPCVVVEVNRPHLWYRVRFTETGFHECYKVPETGPLSWEGKK